MHRSIRCIIIFFQWLQFILKIRCKCHHLTTHRCFQGSQLRTQHWTVHSQKILWTIMGCTNNNERCCLYSLITQRGYWCSKPYRFIVNLILEYNIHTVLRQRRVRTTWRCRTGWFWIIINNNWSILTKWTIKRFYLAEKRKSHVVQHQKRTQRKQ